MRIGIYLASLLPVRTGRERYQAGLIECLGRLEASDEYLLLVTAANAPLFSSPGGRFRHVIVRPPPFPWRRLWEALYLALAHRAHGLDVLHLAEGPVPTVFSGPTVATLYDLVPLLFPSSLAWKGRVYYRHAMALGCRRLRRLAAISRCTREDALRLLRLDPARVSVVYPGCDPRFRPIDDGRALAGLRRRYGLPPRFILHVGTLEPRKNLPRLLRAYRRLKDRGMEHGLVLAGGRGWLYDDVMAERSRTEGVLLTERVVEEDLPLLYNAADLFVLPSLYEGFGFPLLEAMACGTPAVCSNGGALPEVAGDAALLVDGEDEAALAAAMEQGLTDATWRSRVAERGPERARLFSWEEAGRRMLETYREVAAAPKKTARRPQKGAAGSTLR